MSEFGEFIKKRRIELGYTLRAFCIKHTLDCGNHSRLERGIFHPLQGDKLDQMAKHLDLSWEAKEHFKELAERELWPELKKIRELAAENAELKAWKEDVLYHFPAIDKKKASASKEIAELKEIIKELGKKTGYSIGLASCRCNNCGHEDRD